MDFLVNTGSLAVNIGTVSLIHMKPKKHFQISLSVSGETPRRRTIVYNAVKQMQQLNYSVSLSLPPLFSCQIGGIRFLYDNLVESLERYESSGGLGCILAHSMGLGKTLQVISFIDIVLRHTQAHTVLAIVPVSDYLYSVPSLTLRSVFSL